MRAGCESPGIRSISKGTCTSNSTVCRYAPSATAALWCGGRSRRCSNESSCGPESLLVFSELSKSDHTSSRSLSMRRTGQLRSGLSVLARQSISTCETMTRPCSMQLPEYQSCLCLHCNGSESAGSYQSEPHCSLTGAKLSGVLSFK
jgi:hypothetical protein